MRCAPEFKGGLCAALVALATLAPAGGRAGDSPSKLDVTGLDLASLLDLSVEAVTRHVERSSEAPATVFVLTAEDLRRQGFRTVSDALGSVPGLFSYPGRFPQVGVRGMGVIGDYSTRLLVLVDGHPLNNSVGADLGRGLPLPLSAISRIEVIKGPVGSVYGPSAFFGVVNLVTTSAARGGEAWAGLEASGGKTTGWEGAATWRGAQGPVSALASAGLYGSSGRDYRFPELPLRPGAPADGVSRGMDFGDAQHGYLRLRWRGLTASAACGLSYGGLPVSAYPSGHDSLAGRLCMGELAAEGAPLPSLTVTGRLSFDWMDQTARRQTGAPPYGVGDYKVRGNERFPTAELRAEWRPLERLRLDLGSTLQLHEMSYTTASDVIPDLSTRAGRSFTASNTWLAAELTPLDGLTLHGGLTYFNHSIFGDQLTPKLAVVWQPSRDGTLKAIWSRGFRPPTFVEGLLDDHFSFVPNPDLRPEQVTSSELAYEHRLGGQASVTASAFWNEYQGLIRYVAVPAPGLSGPPDPTNPRDFRQQAQNAGTLELYGAELALRLRLGDALEGWGGVSLQRVDQSSRPNFPSVTGNLALSTRAAWRPLLLAARATVVGPRAKDPATVGEGTRSEVPGAMLLGCQATLDVPGVEGLQLEAAVLNLLDARAASPAPAEETPVTELSAAPRTLQVDLRYHF